MGNLLIRERKNFARFTYLKVRSITFEMMASPVGAYLFCLEKWLSSFTEPRLNLNLIDLNPYYYKFTKVYCETVNLIGPFAVFFLLIDDSCE